MECGDLAFASDMADWRAVSFATRYVSVLDQPQRLTTLDGQPLPEDLRGHVVQRLSKDAAPLAQSQRQQLRRQHDLRDLAVLNAPDTGEPALDAATGQPLIVALNGKTSEAAGVETMVGWRAPVGLQIAYGGSAADVLDALQAAFPEVNVLRLDFNASTARSPAAANWAAFARAAAERGYRLIVQNSDGELAGGFVRDAPGAHIMARDRLGPIDALQQPDGQWKINQVLRDWQVMLDWFARPDNALILQAVAGWELINEPMAYGNGPEPGKIYSRHIADLIGALDWRGKRILVGGLGASAQFADLDHDLIRQAAGPALIWSVHLYPTWVVPGYPDLSGTAFRDQLCKRIGSLREPGDDILITETQLYTQTGSLWPASDEKRAVSSFNMARELPWLAEQGIGLTWWPPTGRKSELLTWNGQRSGYSVALDSAAFAHWGWSRSADPTEKGEAWATPGADVVTVQPGGDPRQDRMTDDLANAHGLIFGMAGNDSLQGHDGTDMLYGGDDDDTLIGGGGDDWLFGDRGNDVLEGGDGHDVLIDHEGQNRLSGGAGDDHLEGSGVLDAGQGADRLIAIGQGPFTLTGGPGADLFVPTGAGEITITDFAPAEDRLDWSLLGRQFRCDLDVQQDGQDTVMSWRELRIRLAGVAYDPQKDCLVQRGRRAK
ncbi:calcium-binding protein [Paracoccus shanxieyensis]|uniref:Glycoside hydrolase family 5 domain-containing protein n=1 Tax=Paracoccus shanxieyensis TaxID=2675752 RepID=A0A6L6IYE9_9RHOB|nr:calcium-binding protein [Paracoccus shanxieyensis]MTH64110.1 hypothetical protein [Paracoccus shanxieyensis]MTH86849.1 hypothetical protein [Paracoccus shanxieyensis]